MEEQRLNIYPNREKAFELELKRLEKSDIDPKNKELITKFHNYLFSKGTTKYLRITKLSSQIRRICAKLAITLDTATKKDIEIVMALYNRDTSLSEDTKVDYRRAIKQFYRWFENEDPRLELNIKKATDEEIELMEEAKKLYKYLKDDVSSTCKRKQADPRTIISEEECSIIIEKGCRTPREKAFISMLHESGCRAGEFLNMRGGDIKIQENYAQIEVDGKTGKRPIFLITSLPCLIRYLDVHPYKDSQQSYLWLSEANSNRNQPLLHRGAQKLVDKCFERAKYLFIISSSLYSSDTSFI